jgi:hypothetical protein
MAASAAPDSVMAITKWPITLAVIEQRVNSRIKRQAKRFLEWRTQPPIENFREQQTLHALLSI